MTPRTWALNKALKAWHVHRGGLSDYGAKLLEAEHARSVRIVKREMKSCNHFLALTNDETLKAKWRIRLGVCVNILAALQRGRTRKG